MVATHQTTQSSTALPTDDPTPGFVDWVLCGTPLFVGPSQTPTPSRPAHIAPAPPAPVVTDAENDYTDAFVAWVLGTGYAAGHYTPGRAA